jgi:hypothetical protein
MLITSLEIKLPMRVACKDKSPKLQLVFDCGYALSFYFFSFLRFFPSCDGPHRISDD